MKLAKDRYTDDLFAVKVANKKKLKQKMLGKIKGGVSPLASEIAIMKKLVTNYSLSVESADL